MNTPFETRILSAVSNWTDEEVEMAFGFGRYELTAGVKVHVVEETGATFAFFTSEDAMSFYVSELNGGVDELRMGTYTLTQDHDTMNDAIMDEIIDNF